MDGVISNFFGYLCLYRSELVPYLVIGSLLEALFLVLQKKGCIKYKSRNTATVLCGFFLSFSIALVITMTLYGRTQGTEFAFRFRLFGSYMEAFRENDAELMLQIIMNMVMFVPLGFFLPCCFRVFYKNRVLIFAVLMFSGGIEIIQGVTKIGMFELDDILGNAVGAEIGFCVYWGICKLFCFFKSRGVKFL